MEQTKVCKGCGQELLLSEFYKKESGKYGVTATCKVCNNKRTKVYRETHTEQAKEYRETHRDERVAYDKAYLEIHHDKRVAQKKAYYKTHRDEQLAHKKAYWETHRDERLAYNKAYRETIKVDIICLQCGKHKKVRPGHKFCSPECFYEWNHGEKNFSGLGNPLPMLKVNGIPC